jgi:integrase
MKITYSKEWLTREEYSRLINNPAISRKDELIISLLYGCALRVGELSNLKVKDIDTEKRTLVLWVSKRSKDPALVPIPVTTVKMINQWIKENKRKPNNYLLFSQRANKLSRPQIYRIIRDNGKKAGIKKKAYDTFSAPFPGYSSPGLWSIH